MYLKKSFGINTLSNKVGSMRLRPEWPWRARKKRISLEESGQHWYLFLFPPPLAMMLFHFSSDQCWERTKWFWRSSFSLQNSIAPSSSIASGMILKSSEIKNFLSWLVSTVLKSFLVSSAFCHCTLPHFIRPILRVLKFVQMIILWSPGRVVRLFFHWVRETWLSSWLNISPSSFKKGTVLVDSASSETLESFWQLKLHSAVPEFWPWIQG